MGTRRLLVNGPCLIYQELKRYCGMLEAVVVLVAPVGRAPVASYRSAAEEEQGSAVVVRCYSTLVWYATSLCYAMVRYNAMVWYGRPRQLVTILQQ